MSEDKSDIKLCKVTLLGESGVGKTCIISRYVNNIFEDNVMSTSGASYAYKEISIPDKQTSIRFEIWDTAGQEKYRSITKLFYNDAAAVILVYDVTDTDSLEELKNYWLKQVRDQAPKNAVVAIVGNKNDLIEEIAVPDEEGKKFAQENNAIFMSVSAMSGYSIDNLFMEIGLKFLDPEHIQKLQDELKTANQDTKKNGVKLGDFDRKNIKNKKKKCC